MQKKINPYNQISEITDQLHTLASEGKSNSWRIRKLNRKLDKCLSEINDNYSINIKLWQAK